MADQTSPIQQIAAGSNAIDRVNENFDAASPALMYGRDARSTAGLTWGYVGGRWAGSLVANGTVALTASVTNYVVVNRTTGAVSASSATTNWNNTDTYGRAYLVQAGTESVTGYEDHRAGGSGIASGGAGGGGGGTSPLVIPVACSDETSPLTAGAGKVTFRLPVAMELAEVRASLTTAQASGSIITVDINVNGVSILTTKLTIDNTEKTSFTAAVPAVIGLSSLPDDAEVVIDVDQIGTSGASGLKVYLVGVAT